MCGVSTLFNYWKLLSLKFQVGSDKCSIHFLWVSSACHPQAKYLLMDEDMYTGSCWIYLHSKSELFTSRPMY